jgi:hypothetical protein
MQIKIASIESSLNSNFCSKVDDSTAVVAVIILLFIIPAKPNFWFFRKEGNLITSTHLLECTSRHCSQDVDERSPVKRS